MRDGLQGPDPVLHALAHRYAARELTPAEAAAFEARLEWDQQARDALSEVVRLSAAALGQSPPAPDPALRDVIRNQLSGPTPGRRTQQAHYGHPVVWVTLGSVLAGAAAVIGIMLADTPPSAEVVPVTNPERPAPLVVSAPSFVPTPVPLPQPAPPPREVGPSPATTPVATGDPEPVPSVAELWAEWSTPEHVEKALEDELRWRQKIQNLPSIAPGRTVTLEPRLP